VVIGVRLPIAQPDERTDERKERANDDNPDPATSSAVAVPCRTVSTWFIVISYGFPPSDADTADD
jgi:hypothetical protein